MWLSCDLAWELWAHVTCTTNTGLPPCLYSYHCWLSHQPSGPWGEPLLCACSVCRSSSGRETSPQFAEQTRRRGRWNILSSESRVSSPCMCMNVASFPGSSSSAFLCTVSWQKLKRSLGRKIQVIELSLKHIPLLKGKPRCYTCTQSTIVQDRGSANTRPLVLC